MMEHAPQQLSEVIYMYSYAVIRIKSTDGSEYNITIELPRSQFSYTRESRNWYDWTLLEYHPLASYQSDATEALTINPFMGTMPLVLETEL